MDWKNRFIRPSRRKQVWSKKEKRWLSEEEEKQLLALLAEKQKQIVDAVAKEADVKEEEKPD